MSDDAVPARLVDTTRSVRRPRTLAAVALALIIGATAACPRPTPPDAGPVRVAQRFLDAFSHRQWDTAAALIDSAELRRFRDEQLMMLAQLAEHEREIMKFMSASGSGGMASSGSPLPLDTALVAKHRAWPVRALPGSPTLDEVAHLPARRFYARMYEAPANCWTLPAVRAPRTIGAVLDRDSIAYVVYELRATGFDADTGHVPAVLTMHRASGGKWWVRPRGLAPRLDVLALLDTSAASRDMMARACAAGSSGR